MNDKELCKKCIYYDDFCCRNNKTICVNNSEYRDAEMVINAMINRKEGNANAEYLERESILNAIKKASNLYVDKQGLYLSCELIAEIPAAGVQPVKHGRWKGYITSAFYGCDDEGEPIYRDANFNVCSECGRKTVVKEKFCPNCGAKMDGGDG